MLNKIYCFHLAHLSLILNIVQLKSQAVGSDNQFWQDLMFRANLGTKDTVEAGSSEDEDLHDDGDIDDVLQEGCLRRTVHRC